MERPSLGFNDADDADEPLHPELTPDPDEPGWVIYRGRSGYLRTQSIEEIRELYDWMMKHERWQAHSRIITYQLPLRDVVRLLLKASDFIEIDYYKDADGRLDERAETCNLTYFKAYVYLKVIGRSKQATSAHYSLTISFEGSEIQHMEGDADYDRLVEIADSVLKEYEFTP